MCCLGFLTISSLASVLMYNNTLYTIIYNIVQIIENRFNRKKKRK